MKKKNTISIIVLTIFTLLSCGGAVLASVLSNKPDEPEPIEPITPVEPIEPVHEHVYNQKIETDDFLATPATCVEPATYYYSCECGEHSDSTFNGSQLEPHKFEDYRLVKYSPSPYELQIEATCSHCHLSKTLPCPFVNNDRYIFLDRIRATGKQIFDTGVDLVGKDVKIFIEGAHYISECEETEFFHIGDKTSIISNKKENKLSMINYVSNPVSQTDYDFEDVNFSFIFKQDVNKRTLTINDVESQSSLVQEFNNDRVAIGQKDRKMHYSISRGYIENKGKLKAFYTPVYDKEAKRCGLYDWIRGETIYSDDPQEDFDAYRNHFNFSGHDEVIEVVNTNHLCTEATCQHPATYYKTCPCEQDLNETFTYGEKASHYYIPTGATKFNKATNKITLSYRCKDCGLEINRDFNFDYSKFDLLEYIEATGKQGIDPQIHISDSINGVHIRGESHHKNYRTGIFNLKTEYIYLENNSDANVLILADCTEDNENATYVRPERYYENYFYNFDIFESKDVRTISVNGSSQSYKLNGDVPEKDVKLFYFENPDFGNYVGRFYSMSFDENRETFSYLIPVRNKETGKAGVYDLYRNEFFGDYLNEEDFIIGEFGNEENPVFDKQIVDSKYLKKMADCKSPAQYYFSSAGGMHGDKYFEYGEKLEHDFLTRVTKYPTETKEGEYTQTCRVCGEVITKTLPKIDGSKYEVVDFIQSNGDQYIDTGLKISDSFQNYYMELDEQHVGYGNGYGNGCAFFLTDNTENSGLRKLNVKMDYRYNDAQTTYVYVNNKLYYKNQLGYGWGLKYDTNNTKVALFTLGYAEDSILNNPESFMRIYDGCISFGGELMGAFVPVIDKETGEAGLFDVVRDMFLGNCYPTQKEFVTGKKEDISNFTTLEYIEFDGNHYIDTGEAVPGRWAIDIQFTKTGSKQSMGYSTFINHQLGLNPDGSLFIEDEILDKDLYPADKKISICYDITFGTREILINGEPYSTKELSEDFYHRLGDFVFGSREINSNPCFCKIYGASMYDYNGLARNFVPAQRNSDGQKGLYDLVEGIFYPLKETKLRDIDELLFEDSTIYYDELAMYTSDLVSNIYKNLNDEQDGSLKSRIEMYDGLDIVEFFGHDNSPEETYVHTNQFTFAKKDIYKDGQIYHIYVLTLAGTDGVGEWASDITISKHSNCFATGFEKGADFVLERILPYITYDTEHNMLLITGHSRGAGVGGVIASKLIEDGSKFKQENIKAYLYACPQYSCRDVKYDNVFCINVKEDIVGYLPLSLWGYHTEGQVIYFDMSPETLAKLDAELYRRQDYALYINNKGYIGLNYLEGIKLGESLFPTTELFQDAYNIQYIAEILNLAFSGQGTAEDFLVPATKLFINALLHGQIIKVDSVVNVGTWIVKNVFGIRSTHGFLVYSSWIHVTADNYFYLSDPPWTPDVFDERVHNKLT